MTDLKLKYNDTLKGSSSKIESARRADLPGTTETDEVSGSIRNICFVLADGKRIFLNYSYLISGEFIPNENVIILSFTSHIVTLKGHALEELYYDLMCYKLSQIQSEDKRYIEIQEELKSVVQEIEVKKNES